MQVAFVKIRVYTKKKYFNLSRGEKTNIIGVSKVLLKAIVFITQGKLHLHLKKPLGISKELFEFAIRILVSQICSNCTCLTLILSPHIFIPVHVRVYLFFFLVHYENTHNQPLVIDPSFFGGNSQSENYFELLCAFLSIKNYYFLLYYAWLHEVYR